MLAVYELSPLSHFNRLCTRLSLTLLGVCHCRLWLATLAWAGIGWSHILAATEVPVIAADYRKVSEFDPGTLRVVIDRRGNSTQAIREVRLNDVAIPVWGLSYQPAGDDSASAAADPFEHAQKIAANKRVIWARLDSVGESNAFVVFLAKLATEPAQQRQKLTFVSGDNQSSTVLVSPSRNALAVTAIRTAEDGRRIYVFLVNQSTEKVDISGVELDGALVARRHLWLPSRTLIPGEHSVVVISVENRMVRGERHLLAVCGNEAQRVIESFRVLPVFPMTTDWGVPPTEAGIDNAAFTVTPKYLTTTITPFEHRPSTNAQAINVFECAMHTYKARLSASANEIFRRVDLCRRHAPTMLTAMHLCRIRPEEGYAKFGETVDILSVNPNIPTSVSRPAVSETARQTVARVIHYAVNSAAPRPVHSVLQTTRLDDRNAFYSAAEFRQIAYTILGHGVKGIAYRHTGWTRSKLSQLNQAIIELNGEINAMRPWLLTAAPWPMNGIRAEDVTVYTLFAPDVGILLFVIGDHVQESVELSIPTSPALNPTELLQITARGHTAVDFETSGTSIICTLPTPHSANAFLLRCQRLPRE